MWGIYLYNGTQNGNYHLGFRAKRGLDVRSWGLGSMIVEAPGLGFGMPLESQRGLGIVQVG